MKNIQRKKSPKLSPGTRQEIKEMFDSGSYKPKAIADYFHCSIHQVNAVIYGKVKMRNEVRSDKGLKRRSELVEDRNGTSEAKEKDQSLVQRLQKTLGDAVTDLEKRNYAPDLKLTLIEKASRLLKNLDALELQSHMKGSNAELMMKIMLRLQPELTLEEIKKIYLEEYEKIKNSSE